jgi:hypothetical protein
MFEDSALRILIYDEIVRTGETPAVATLARLVNAPLDDVRASLRRMHTHIWWSCSPPARS